MKKGIQVNTTFHLFQASSKPLLVILKVYLSKYTQAVLKPYQKEKTWKKSKNWNPSLPKGVALSFVVKGTGAVGAVQAEKRKKTIRFKNGQRNWIHISPKKTYRWPTGTWKCAQHHWSSGKCKSKPQEAIILHLLEWLLSKRQEIASVGKDVEKREPLCTVGGNVNWCSHCGKQNGGSSKNLK